MLYENNITPLTIKTSNHISSLQISLPPPTPPSQSFSSTQFPYMDLPAVPWDQLEAGSEFVSLDNSRFQKDLDSIDKFIDEDDIDAAKIGYMKNINLGQNEKNVQTQSTKPLGRQRDEEDDEKEDKTVKCLYYALQCCECTIS